jgi:hypothetical protein
MDDKERGNGRYRLIRERSDIAQAVIEVYENNKKSTEVIFPGGYALVGVDDKVGEGAESIAKSDVLSIGNRFEITGIRDGRIRIENDVGNTDGYSIESFQGKVRMVRLDS